MLSDSAGILYEYGLLFNCLLSPSDLCPIPDNLGIKEARQVVLDEKAVLDAMERDLDALGDSHPQTVSYRQVAGCSEGYLRPFICTPVPFPPRLQNALVSRKG